MAKKTIVTEVASALGTAAARVENLKPKRSPSTKHSKAKTIAAIESEPIKTIDENEIARLAYLYWEARGYQGGSAEEDWVRAEQELKSNTVTL
jgi:hypothetical protein